MDTNFLQNLHNNYKEKSLYGKWIRHEQILPLMEGLQDKFKVAQVGSSEEDRSIHSLDFGTGPMKILIWTQMHGNESTGTKAVFDLLNVLVSDNEIGKTLESVCTIKIIPMLNPDGAEQYTRVNANEVDLNRDAVAVSAEESKVLQTVLDDFQPKFCFNMHDQRTIFGVEGTHNPATLSFLAPSEEVTKQITPGRKETMNVIVAMNSIVQQFIPNGVGRYTDEFYPTATGDNFQKMGYNTILIESGHFPKDYVREKSREFTFYALLSGLHHIATTTSFNDYEPYFDIPNNNKDFLDVIHRFSNKADEGYQYEDVILENQLVSRLRKVELLDVSGKIGHFEIVFDNE